MTLCLFLNNAEQCKKHDHGNQKYRLPWQPQHCYLEQCEEYKFSKQFHEEIYIISVCSTSEKHENITYYFYSTDHFLKIP